MKQVLLRVTAVFAKICFRKFAQPEFGDFFLPRKILLSKTLSIQTSNWKCAQSFVGKEHYAVGNLRSDSRATRTVSLRSAIGQSDHASKPALP